MLDVKIVCEDKKYMPQYSNPTDACMDLKVKVDWDNDCSNNSVIIYPNETKKLETGVKIAVPKDHVMLVFPRSSTGFKLNCMLANTTGVIDDGYKDTIILAIHNYGENPIEIVDGQRIAQFMILPRPFINLIPTEDNEEFRKGDRGGGIGSTGI